MVTEYLCRSIQFDGCDWKCFSPRLPAFTRLDQIAKLDGLVHQRKENVAASADLEHILVSEFDSLRED